MTTPAFVQDLRRKVGNALLVLPTVSAIVRDEAERILLIRHANDGLWTTPGGCVEPDESPEDAVAREVLEETGLTITPERLLAVCGGADFRVRYRNGDKVSCVVALYECQIAGGELQPDGEEALEARFFEPSGLPSADLAPGFGRALLERAGAQL
jgi:ADP-ribose pyrophosphatase YjhB (NUDIX family)